MAYRPILPSDLLYPEGKRLIFPGGFILSESTGTPDPLAGIAFEARWQTHNGDNVPLGLYQDVACTIPSMNEFDTVAAWRDELSESGSGVIASQADPSKQPLLVFVNGVPMVEFDGVDDFLSHPVSLDDNDNTFVIVGKALSAQVNYHSVVQAWADNTSVYGGLWSSTGAVSSHWGIGGINPDVVGTDSTLSFLVVMAERVGATCSLYEAGTLFADETGTFYGGDSAGRRAIAGVTSGNELSYIQLGTVMIRSSVNSSERATIQAYLDDIFSPVL